ncbi:alpha/beta hydrolase [Streptomyces bambusae]|uniref:alpha/beta fold hydrolase n=1 Tax=Streptomyces bambusae TaxID=1550616 RepID=UPI001CFFE788|nr:alpha/beta hydrolase [Streptomyces bambusae]MCB5170080.1 alpha/beta hydrolase [Streptomyces bambusae]
MTDFVLVSGGHTGGWIWREVAERLRAAGAVPHAATLTGLGDRRHLAGPATDLDTHIEDLVQLIDHIDAPQVVLVGHCYGMFPVTGAADRRADRIAHVIAVDTGHPRDGASVAGLLPEGHPAAVRVHERIATAADGWRIPPPPPEDHVIWGSTAGISEPDLTRMMRLAAPQPAGTLTRPLRLTGAAAHVPSSAVFCTENGLSTDAVEQLLAAGDPTARALAAPDTRYFDLPTGHWPMLSAPAELAGVLLEAAAGGGRKLV